ncbi:MAG: alkaline phosphatase PafA [Flavobacteriales bacterium]|nr:alkaline phosphatase PafA [Flavobacteriales bacterium]
MKLLYPVILVMLSACSLSQTTVSTDVEPNVPQQPKLIIGITVDQMRYDFIDKYWEDFGAGGFKRLVGEGFFARNLHYNYMPTYTGPGHASIFTGTTPANHGIVANDWYDRDLKALMYCAKDDSVKGVGTMASEGQRSPVHLLSTTMGDEMKIFSNMRSKVIGIAMKDRGGILPAGRMADAAYWYIGANEGNWVSSDWYMNTLPQWVQDFNAKKLSDSYLKNGWSLIKAESVYDESIADNNAFEAPFKGQTKPVFPYNLDSLRSLNLNYDLIKATPWGNTHTVDFAIATIEGEQMGSDDITDMLCVSFSSTDYIGHQFGIHSRETQDCYLRLDADLERFINFLDGGIGRENYLIFLSADHGGAPTPSYVMKENAAAGYWKTDSLVSAINHRFEELNYAVRVENYSNDQVFFTTDSLLKYGYNHPFAQEEACRVAMQFDGVHMAFTHNELSKQLKREGMARQVQMGFNQNMSGDVVIVTEPGWMKYSLQGTTHGSPWVYDTHVPAIFFGFNVKQGESFVKHSITDIAPTITSLCKLPMPNACTGEPILEVLQEE